MKIFRILNKILFKDELINIESIKPKENTAFDKLLFDLNELNDKKREIDRWYKKNGCRTPYPHKL